MSCTTQWVTEREGDSLPTVALRATVGRSFGDLSNLDPSAPAAVVDIPSVTPRSGHTVVTDEACDHGVRGGETVLTPRVTCAKSVEKLLGNARSDRGVLT